MAMLSYQHIEKIFLFTIHFTVTLLSTIILVDKMQDFTVAPQPKARLFIFNMCGVVLGNFFLTSSNHMTFLERTSMILFWMINFHIWLIKLLNITNLGNIKFFAMVSYNTRFFPHVIQFGGEDICIAYLWECVVRSSKIWIHIWGERLVIFWGEERPAFPSKFALGKKPWIPDVANQITCSSMFPCSRHLSIP